MDFGLILMVVTGMSLVGTIVLTVLVGRQYQLQAARLAALAEAEDASRQVEYEEATARLDALNEEVTGVEQARQAAELDINSVRQELESERLELEAVAAEVSTARIGLAEDAKALALTNAEVAAAQRRHDSMTASVLELEQRQAALTRENGLVGREVASAQSDVVRLREEAEGIGQEIEAKRQFASAELTSLAQKRDELRSECDALAQKRSEFEEELSDLRPKLTQCREEFSQLAIQIDRKRAELKEIEEQIKENTRRNLETASRLSEDDAESLAHLQMDLVALTEDVKNKRSWIAEVELRAAALNAEAENLDRRIDANRQLLEKAEGDAVTASQRRSELRSEIDELELRRSSLANENVELERELSTLMTQKKAEILEKFRVEISSTEHDLMTKRALIADLEQQGVCLSDEEVRLQVELDHGRKALAKVAEDIEAAESRRTDMIVQIRALEDRRSVLTNEHDADRASNALKAKGAVSQKPAGTSETSASKPQGGQKVRSVQKRIAPVDETLVGKAVHTIDSALSSLFFGKPKVKSTRPTPRKE